VADAGLYVKEKVNDPHPVRCWIYTACMGALVLACPFPEDGGAVLHWQGGTRAGTDRCVSVPNGCLSSNMQGYGWTIGGCHPKRLKLRIPCLRASIYEVQIYREIHQPSGLYLYPTLEQSYPSLFLCIVFLESQSRIRIRPDQWQSALMVSHIEGICFLSVSSSRVVISCPLVLYSICCREIYALI
jgi:hypothetical protein